MKTYADRPWLENMDSRIGRNPVLPEFPVHQFLTDSFHKYPNHKALYFYGTEFTYAELESLCNKLANGLTGLGIGKGDRVAICMDNCPPVCHRLLCPDEGRRRGGTGVSHGRRTGIALPGGRFGCTGALYARLSMAQGQGRHRQQHPGVCRCRQHLRLSSG